jgi:MFS transporter, putative metabolite:H+ symporter
MSEKEVPIFADRSVMMLVLVAALGYFVDIYDLVLFGVVRIPSLRDLGVSEEKMMETGGLLLNSQMMGMLLGGILWGVLGDKKGRVTVLFGSIIMYSLANIANGMVQTIPQYVILRFIAGVGLAGELGAGVTLVSETMHRTKRGIGTMIIAAVGISGAVVAFLVAEKFQWRISYYVGGGMGLALLALRFGVYESGMFKSIMHANVKKGNFLMIFSKWERVKKYFSVILVAIPIWFTVGILMTFSYEIGGAMNMPVKPDPARAIMFCYIGLSIGDLSSGLLSQFLRSRTAAIGTFMIILAMGIVMYFFFGKTSLSMFYVSCVICGFGAGYWAVFMSTASELFGTNLRATVTTTAPNFVRGSVVLLTTAFMFFSTHGFGGLVSAMIVGNVSFALALWALNNIEDTFEKDLDYIEE